MIFKFQWYIVDENGIYNGMITGLKKPNNDDDNDGGYNLGI